MVRGRATFEDGKRCTIEYRKHNHQNREAHDNPNPTQEGAND